MDNECKSECNVFPRGNNVLVKMMFKSSVLDLSSGKPGKEANSEHVDFYVAGFGPLVKDLTIGDKIQMVLQEYEDVPVKGNSKSLKEYMNTFRSMKQHELQDVLRSTPKVDVIQYGIFPEFIIKSIIK